MAKNPQFNNFTEDTALKIYNLLYEILANQIANPYGVEVKVTTRFVDKKETASAQGAYILTKEGGQAMKKPIIPIERAKQNKRNEI